MKASVISLKWQVASVDELIYTECQDSSAQVFTLSGIQTDDLFLPIS